MSKDITITISRDAALVAHDNLYDRLREEDEDDMLDPVVASLTEILRALEAQGVSSR